MSYQDGRAMDRPPPQGSVRRARERAMAGMPSEDIPPPRMMFGGMDDEPQIARPSMSRQMPMGMPSGSSRIPRPPQASGLQTRDGQIGVAISRPTPMPQWPLPAPIADPTSSNGESYQPPPGRSQPPQRPPRPSRVPSMLDSSKIQDITPSFQYRPEPSRESSDLLMLPETASSISRPSTLSSVGSIPDFPLPAQLPPGPPRRSVNLGPPPSARRGASSFYSNASYVSPIPEESPRSRSHASHASYASYASQVSYASSAAMPDGWGSPSPGPSPNYPDFYDDIIVEEGVSVEGEDEEERGLVRSASLGKRAKPTLVSQDTPRGTDGGSPERRPGPVPVQKEPFRDGTGYIDYSSSSSTVPKAPKAPAPKPVTTDAMLNAYSSASETNLAGPTDAPGQTPSPQPPAYPQPPQPAPGSRSFSRLSAIRRPPRLDIDAVAKAEARGSLTSLPDLIKRATRLAASLEKGKRPASRFDDMDDDRAISFDGEKHQSGFSDMLAAFPPPAHAGAPPGGRRSWRDSIRQQIQSWPLPLSNRTPHSSRDGNAGAGSERSEGQGKRGRRCCGLPMWGFIVVMVVIVLSIAAAVVIPVEFLVIRKQSASRQAQAALDQCESQLTCANGGSNVVNQGTCSCLCTNGFTGFDCTVAPSSGCTTISLTGDRPVSGVTVGDAIPRLLQQSEVNFSVPLSSTEVVSKLIAGNLSCSAMNALVTFDGQATRQAVVPPGVLGAVESGMALTTVTIMVGQFTTITLDPDVSFTTTQTPATGGGSASAAGNFNTVVGIGGTGGFDTTITLRNPTPTVTSTVTRTIPLNTQTPTASAMFDVTDDALDFARVSVLYILQESNLADATSSQAILQRFFNSASPGALGGGVTIDRAQNLGLGNGNSIDLVNFLITTRKGVVGASRRSVKARSPLTALPFEHL
ncbi:hypothetical protein QBC39DRAFT_14603 [Podospora conica]|nr:hypothetical protein QBC39DRAFT_14603 [Schizothecium conicum]